MTYLPCPLSIIKTQLSKLQISHSEPMFESICKLHREVIINVQCVHSDLGGGTHGHLGLLLATQEYALHSNTAYHCPEHPGPL